MTILRNPVLPGFNPDPSIVRVEEPSGPAFYLATSSFEYLPGIPIHRSEDLVSWELIGHVATRPGQLGVGVSPTSGGAWAPTIRHHDGLFHLVVTDAMGRGNLLFTAQDAAGPWSDGLAIGVVGIDPDIAWDESAADGSAIITFSGLLLPSAADAPVDAAVESGDAIEWPAPGEVRHLGIQQARVDLGTGQLLEAPRSMWSGTGLMFPEAPHLYRIGDWWYLLIAEGGTERGHTVSVARSRSPYGDFEGCPANPVLSARSTDRPIQNTGHADLFQAADGTWHIVLLGMRVKGLTRSFAALGRETFSTPIDWVDGWPIPRPVHLDPELDAPSFTATFAGNTIGPEWVSVRRLPSEVASIEEGALVLRSEGRMMDDRMPTFVGRRQRRLDAVVRAVLDASNGTGGLCVRYDEEHHYDIELRDDEVIARACLPTILQEWRAPIGRGPVTLVMEMHPTVHGTMSSRMTCDRIALAAVTGEGRRIDLAELDGRFLAAETACSFTGRVIGVYAVTGAVRVLAYSETGPTSAVTREASA